MVQLISNLCKKCGGPCCKEYDIFLSKKDINNIKKFKGKFKIKKEDNSIYMSHYRKCCFLSEKGCILKENQKPLDCRLFPLVFIFNNKKIEFYIMKDCKYFKKLPKQWIKSAKLIAKNGVKNWTEKDKKTYTNIIKKYALRDSIRI